MHPRIRGVLIAVPLLIALTAVSAVIFLVSPRSSATQQASDEATAMVGGDFRLTTHEGRPLSNDDLRGTPFAVFFGFTHCPDICPTTLWEMTEAMKALGPKADALKVIFVTLDPARDTADQLKSYLEAFDPRIIALTGTEEETAAVARAYRVYWKKVSTEGDDYTLDHSAAVYLMDKAGGFTGFISYEDSTETRVEKLTRLVDGQ